MPGPLSSLDLIAVAVFLAAWFGYSLLFHGRRQPAGSINKRMFVVREMWMVRFLERENRMVDAQLNGASIATSTFFASATIIVIGALIGVLGVSDRVHAATTTVSPLLGSTSLALFELKLFALITVFIFAFFKFTWAIRQFSYFSAIIGSAPVYAPGQADRTVAHRMARIRSQAVGQLNAGLRAYYFALAGLGWFIHPGLFMATTVLIALVLLHRQLSSRAARLIDEHASHLT